MTTGQHLNNDRKSASFFGNLFRECKPVCGSGFRVVGFLLAFAPLSAASAQGILTVSPGATAGTTAGTGTLGFGNNASATSGTLAAPSAVAFDAAGNIYVADTRNHAIRKVVPGGAITTVAGSGTAGYTGDGAAATSAQLDTPTGVAVDATGNIYIADSRNHVVRKVTVATGFISTIAGTGSAGFSGDGSAATSATLALPSAVAVDSTGNVYIADTNNQRIRKITGSTISTIAGNGVQGFSGDSGAATAAALDSPVGVAVDGSGNVYVADRHNQRIRVVSGGNILTVVGGTSSFSGGFAGDGATATAATLAHPSGISIDAAGNLYVADTNNQRIRKITGTTIATIIGNGVQGAAIPGNAPSATPLNSPVGAIGDSLGNVLVADKLNNTITGSGSAYLSYTAQAIGTTSTGKTVTLSNTGTANITVTAPTYTGPFSSISGGTCTFPATITVGNNCTVLVGYTPTATGAQSGVATFSGTNVVSTTLQLAGSGSVGTPSVAVSAVSVNYGTATATLSATISYGGTTPAGAVTFKVDSGSSLTANCVTGSGSESCTVSYPTSSLTVGAHTITAAIAADSNYVAANGTNTLTVNDTLGSIQVTGITANVNPGVDQTATVTIKGASGATLTGFTGSVTVTSTDASATISPVTYAFVAGDLGVHTFTVAFNTGGTYSVTATSSAVSGSEANIRVGDYIWAVSTTGAVTRTSEGGGSLGSAAGNQATATYGAAAFDSTGQSYTVVNTANSITRTSKTGGAVTTLTGGGLNAPTSIAVDGAGVVWVANSGNNSVSEFTNSGTAVSGATGFAPASVTAPSGVAIDTTGGLWVTNRTANTVTHLFGVATPVVTPLATAAGNAQLGVTP